MKRFASIAAFLFWLLIVAGCALGREEFRGAAYSVPASPPNFSLPATQGETFTLNEHTGKVVLLFFGYTHCPDICPATLGTIKTALNQLSSAERQDIAVVFVTVDPERDTVERLGQYLDSFNAGYIGVVPTFADLDAFRADYGLVADKEEVQPDGSYWMAHTGLVYVLDRAGHLRLGFFSGATADDMAHDIRLLLKEVGNSGG